MDVTAHYLMLNFLAAKWPSYFVGEPLELRNTLRSLFASVILNWNGGHYV
jgi:hypothetical protein